MGVYLTTYHVLSSDRSRYVQYGSHLVARSFSDANRVAKMRGIGETVEGVCKRGRAPELSVLDLLKRRSATHAQKLHALIFLGWLAVKSKARTLDEVFSDTGFVHEFAHSMAFGDRKLRQRLLKEIASVQSDVPGVERPHKRATEGK